MLSALIVLAGLSSVPAAKPLALAYRDGDVAVVCRSFSGHTIARLDIENRRREETTVDLNGSYLVPEVDLHQRLGLGLLRAGSGLTEVRLKPGARLQVKVLSVCMEFDKESPRDNQRYRLAKRLAPRRVLRILRGWKTHPDVPQASVQSVVWGHSRAFARTPNAMVVTASDLQVAREYLSVGQRLFVLTGDDKLFCGTWARTPRLLDWKVISLYGRNERLSAIRRIPARRPKGALKTVVSRLDRDTGGWADLLEAVPGRLLWVSPDGDAAIVRSFQDSVLHLTASGKRTLLERPRAISVSTEGLVYWVSDGSPLELLSTDESGKSCTVYRHNEAIRTVLCPSTKPYLLDDEDNLLVLEGKKRFRLTERVVSIQPVGERLLVKTGVTRRNGHRVAPGLRIYEGHRLLVQLPHPRHMPQHFFLYPSSDVLLTVDGGFTVRKWDSARRKWDTVASLTRGESMERAGDPLGGAYSSESPRNSE